MQKYIDLHSHSSHSPDADHSVADMCRAAEQKGLYAYAVTDHCEMNDFIGGGYVNTIPASLAEMEQVRSSEEWKTVLLKGIEVGQALENRAVSDSFLDDVWGKTDFILGSLHNMVAYTDFAFLDYHNENIPALLKRYFTELLSLAEWGRFDSLAHMTYPLRYMKAQGFEVDLDPYKKQIDEILSCLAKTGHALEVNTSGLRQTMRETMPPFWVVRRFKELGGHYVTVGSDSHCTQDVGKGIAEAICLIKEAGFQTLTYYVQHKPVELPIL